MLKLVCCVATFAVLAICPTTLAGTCELVIHPGGGDTMAGLSVGSNAAFYTTPATIIDPRCMIIQDNQGAILLALWNEQKQNEPPRPFYGISLNGGTTIDRITETSYLLRTKVAAFDPLSSQPTIIPGLLADASVNLYFVQCEVQPIERLVAAVSSLGGIVRKFLPYHTLVVQMSSATSMMVEGLPFVRWVGSVHPAYRLEDFLRANFDDWSTLVPLQRYRVQVFDPEVGQIAAVRDHILMLGGTVNAAAQGAPYLEATLTPPHLASIIRRDEVAFVSRWQDYTLAMDHARAAAGAAYLDSVAGFGGNAVRGLVIDTAIFQHFEFTPPPIIMPPVLLPFNCHGTNVYSTVFSDGSGNPQATGVLPSGEGIFLALDNLLDEQGINPGARLRYTCLSASSGSPETCQQECGFEIPETDPNCPYRAVFQTNSWTGHSQAAGYEMLAAEMDQAVFDYDMLICQAQGNVISGHCPGFEEAWAKNVVSVGGIRHHDTTCRDDDEWANGGCPGPASDGRQKPDLSFFHDDITTATPLNAWGGALPPCVNPEICPCNQDYRPDFRGTSAATPIVCGYFGLFFEMWGKPAAPGGTQNIFGRLLTSPNGNVFDNRARAATAKAMVMNTSQPYEVGGGISGDINRNNAGWGWPNIRKIYELRDRFPVIVNEDVVLQEFERYTEFVTVDPQTPALRITMAFTDAPGSGMAELARINDFALRAVAPSGQTYVGNWRLDNDNWSDVCSFVSPCPKDTINNVENIFVENPEPGIWEINVTADELAEDGHPETPSRDGDFALVVSLELPPCPYCHLCATATDCCPDGDGDVCTINLCTAEGYCQVQATKYGNVTGDVNDIVNLDDILCVLGGFSNPASCPHGDIGLPCSGDGMINLDDILRVLAAFGGENPCGCAP